MRRFQSFNGRLQISPGLDVNASPLLPAALVFHGINCLQLFAIREKEGFTRGESFDITNFDSGDVATLWEKVKNEVEVVDKLAPTPWGSYRFVIKDPDGYHIAFVDKKSTYKVEK